MSHSVETMAYSGQVPWHGLGVQVEDNLNVDEMLKAAKLDWSVSKHSMFFNVNGDYNGVYLDVDNSKALVRDSDNAVLSIVSDDWEPCQNDEAFSIFEPFVEDGTLKLETAGSLKGGQIVWGLAKLDNKFDVFKGDVIEQYLLLINPHKFHQSIQMRSTSVRVVCNNTLDVALNSASKLQITQNHKNAFSYDMFHDVLLETKELMVTYKEAAEFLGSKRYTAAKVTDYFEDVFASKFKNSRNVVSANELLETQPGHEFAKGSWWQAFNAITYMSDHQQTNDREAKLHSSWFGVNKTRKTKALSLALNYAEAA
jgi:phage/plasmid-like protein (TIGR03299 family)